jgi:beta-glucanase (GH16 family)
MAHRWRNASIASVLTAMLLAGCTSAGAEETPAAAPGSASAPATEVGVAATAPPVASTKAPNAVAAAPKGWKLTWSDEFNATKAGTAPNAKKWVYDLGGEPKWGNNEWQFYTKRKTNVAQDGKGRLVITARKEKLPGMAGCRNGTCDITSARITTKGKFQQKYGRFEARLKIPAGQGFWPAFWMLGDTGNFGEWPDCGEIDIMEAIGSRPGNVEGTAWGKGFPDHGLGGDHTMAKGVKLSSGFHTFAVQWSATSIAWYVDKIRYYTLTKSALPSGATWAFDHAFYPLLNLAVGGEMPGSPTAKTPFPSTLVYRRA